MPILNSVYKGQKLFASKFFCPHCFVIRDYDIRPMSNDVAFIVIPLLEKNEPQHVVVCKVCKKAFDLDILTRNIQSLYKLAGAARCQFDKGISPGSLKLKLVSDGLKEEFIDKLIRLAQS